MYEELLKNLDNSYSPYSGFPVSSIVVMNDGASFSGVNIENASYGATICAERTAIFRAVSEGYRKEDFKELHVMVGSGKIGTPCFICRQVISEFMYPEKKIVCWSTEGDFEEYSVGEMCTFPFGSDDLGKL